MPHPSPSWSPEHMAKSSHHSAPHYAVSSMSNPLLISFMCTIPLGLSSLFLIPLTIIQIHHFFLFSKASYYGATTHPLFLVCLFNPKTSILEGLFNCRAVKVFAYLLFLKAYACINGIKMWKKFLFFNKYMTVLHYHCQSQKNKKSMQVKHLTFRMFKKTVALKFWITWILWKTSLAHNFIPMKLTGLLADKRSYVYSFLTSCFAHVLFLMAYIWEMSSFLVMNIC
jgi:hypothetical protein